MTQRLNSDLVTTQEAAAIAGVNPRTIKRWHVAGKLTGYRNQLNGRIWYSREELSRKLNAE